jgi:hypothetical protein
MARRASGCQVANQPRRGACRSIRQSLQLGGFCGRPISAINAIGYMSVGFEDRGFGDLRESGELGMAKAAEAFCEIRWSGARSIPDLIAIFEIPPRRTHPVPGL